MMNPVQNAQGYEPIAGCRPVFEEPAAQYDRRWLVVDETGAWLSPQQAPGLANIQVALLYGYLALRAPGMLRMDVPLEVEEDDDSVMRTAVIGAASIPVVDEGDLLAAPPDVPVAWPDQSVA